MSAATGIGTSVLQLSLEHLRFHWTTTAALLRIEETAPGMRGRCAVVSTGGPAVARGAVPNGVFAKGAQLVHAVHGCSLLPGRQLRLVRASSTRGSTCG